MRPFFEETFTMEGILKLFADLLAIMNSTVLGSIETGQYFNCNNSNLESSQILLFSNFVSRSLVLSCDTLSLLNTNCLAAKEGDVSWWRTKLSRLLMRPAVTSLISGFSSPLGILTSLIAGYWGDTRKNCGDTFAPSEFPSICTFPTDTVNTNPRFCDIQTGQKCPHNWFKKHKIFLIKDI